MKLTIEFNIENVHNALSGPHSRSWTNDCYWDPHTCTGYVVDYLDENEPEIELNMEKLEDGLIAMQKTNPYAFGRVISGNSDGVDGDTLLQCMAFGERKYE